MDKRLSVIQINKRNKKVNNGCFWIKSFGSGIGIGKRAHGGKKIEFLEKTD
jgi:hypothetical protein